jgi:hypothetical protein
MAEERFRPPLRLDVQEAGKREKGARRFPRSPEAYPKENQWRRFGPAFDRLADVLGSARPGLALRADPRGLAPERLLVFEVRGAIDAFASAVRSVDGLELVDVEELDGDPSDKAPVAYLVMPDLQALNELVSLWKRWNVDEQLARGRGGWSKVFSHLRDLRPWGPHDRISETDRSVLEEDLLKLGPGEVARLELELVFRRDRGKADEAEKEVRERVSAEGGKQLARCRIDSISYHALLVEVPADTVRAIVDRTFNGLAGFDPIMSIRPQATADVAVAAEDHESGSVGEVKLPSGDPILAIIDGVPASQHPKLAGRVKVEDLFNLEPTTPVVDRTHGTAMASLIVWGDLNRDEPALERPLLSIPVLGRGERFPMDRLVIDMLYTAVLQIVSGDSPIDPEVLIINLSLGNPNAVFQGRPSPWARLVDRLAHQCGILFVVSAGNHRASLPIQNFNSFSAFEDADAGKRADATLMSLNAVMADRRLLAPAESINAVTVGALNEDAVPDGQRTKPASAVQPYGSLRMANSSSALGLGFARSIKPELLLAGGREHLRLIRNSPQLQVGAIPAGRHGGLKVAAPEIQDPARSFTWSGGTSAAAALASRTAHRIHDVLERAYQQDFLRIPKSERAALLKAMLVHGASWPDETATFIERVLHPDGRAHQVHKKDSIRRYVGYGILDPGVVVSCAENRVTCWATGVLAKDTVLHVEVPLPSVIGGQAKHHCLIATLAWLAPVGSGTLRYRAVKLSLAKPGQLDSLALKGRPRQPDTNQASRGTVIHRIWEGDRAPSVSAGDKLSLQVQRERDPLDVSDEAVPFALVITLAMKDTVGIYEEVRQALGVQIPVGI